MIQYSFVQADKAADTVLGLPWWAWLIIIIVIILLLAYWLNRPKETSAPEHAVEDTLRAVPVHVESAVVAPEHTAQPDDLTKLEGIGLKVNSILQAAGIRTFTQLAASDVVQLKRLLEAARLPMIDPGAWPEQAKLAAEGKWEEFEKLTASLKGGRRA